MRSLFRSVKLFTGLFFFGFIALEPLSAGDRQVPENSDIRRFELQVEKRQIKGGISRIVVTQGNWVELHWYSDEPVQVHLHGYDIKQQITVGSPAVTRFHAHATGRFSVTAHGFGEPTETKDNHGSEHHHRLLYLEVHPK